MLRFNLKIQLSDRIRSQVYQMGKCNFNEIKGRHDVEWILMAVGSAA